MRLYASASSVETLRHFFPVPSESPLIAATPILIPVNEPGPAEQAKKSISEREISEFLSAESIIGKSVLE